MNRLATRHLVLGLALCSLAGLAAGNDAPQDAIARLRQTGEVSCRPSLPFFCGNMHVSCGGLTALETFAFKLRATLTHGSIATSSEAKNAQSHYENGRVDWDSAGRYAILFSGLKNNGYIKLHTDGTYIFRHYPLTDGVMSLGHCN